MRFIAMLLTISAMVGFCQDATKPAAQPTESYLLVKLSPESQDLFMREVAEFLEKAGHFYLASFDGKAARVRPIKFTFVVDNRVLFVTSKKKEMYGQLINFPEVEISRTAADNSTYLRYKGKAVPCAEPDIKAKLLERFPFFEKNFGDNLALFTVDPEKAGLFSTKKEIPAKTKIYAK
ncbi:MAG: pyridoxamine 5'-phosphate oxidase family protein [Kiritimatiellae bacterium]|nr:pyridoxamine 5'-phosphate oxidase family protein [Kiritimatiellia bacterium]